MSALPQNDILGYLNLCRENPQKFSKYIKEEIDKFHPDGRTLPLIKGCNYSTNEGKSAWEECFEVLENAKPLPAYNLSKSLSTVAQSHANDMSAHNFMSHQGSNGASMEQRIARFCEKPSGYGLFASGENIGTDFNFEGRNHALNGIKALLIDDGVSNRGHRKNNLSTTFQYVGIGSSIVGDKIFIVLVFNTHDPAVKGSGKPTEFENKKPVSQSSPNENKIKIEKFSKGWGSEFENNDDFNSLQERFNQLNLKNGKMLGDITEKSNNTDNNGRYVVSQKNSSSTTTKNGHTIKKITSTLVYSDGTTEVNENIEETY